jgi:hypothetical protein
MTTLRTNGEIMKKTTVSKVQRGTTQDLRAEYRFDYSKAQPNRFASRVNKDQVVVVLDPDIADVFTSGEAVNRVLRALITNMPQPARPKRPRRPATPVSLP